MKAVELSRVAAPAKKRHPAAIVSGLVVLLVVACLVSLTLGRYSMPWSELLHMDTTSINVLVTMRLPRIAAAVIIGAALSGAGCAFQGIFKNPMVSPDLLGASSGASFGAALGILLSLGTVGIEVLAFIVGIAAVALTYVLSTAIGKRMGSVLVMVLSGMVVGKVFEALIGAVKFVADPNSQLPEITFWLMGGLSSVNPEQLIWLGVAFLIGTVGLSSLRWRLNVMSMGDEEAAALGVDVKQSRLIIIGFATLLTSASVAIAGMVGWVGLIVPHLARFLVGSDHRVLLPASMLLGASFLLFVDGICRSIYTTEIPLSILTAILGAPLFIYLICKQRKVR